MTTRLQGSGILSVEQQFREGVTARITRIHALGMLAATRMMPYVANQDVITTTGVDGGRH